MSFLYCLSGLREGYGASFSLLVFLVFAPEFRSVVKKKGGQGRDRFGKSKTTHKPEMLSRNDRVLLRADLPSFVSFFFSETGKITGKHFTRCGLGLSR